MFNKKKGQQSDSAQLLTRAGIIPGIIIIQYRYIAGPPVSGGEEGQQGGQVHPAQTYGGSGDMLLMAGRPGRGPQRLGHRAIPHSDYRSPHTPSSPN